ncbi:flagellar basal body-associated protein FliL [Pseudomonas sp. FW306-02-F02-AA]|uniref:Lysozyme n=1 Tax=Pseudomonas fluorescens TaxID=294 RepID=A0A0N9WJG1_PSEFL|nr:MULTISPECIES: lysis system i-spanin subunit Rz [Pseudomonas]ALI02654.1 lysozyme [Pseudomonas fluorescens]PMZ05096.1 flagellar basal body-associated protein FliL [Pseudomonas sp. FW306-02-F02-AB]PMZ10835.1 flagellar basal body-associated protein FliL [Pseudomonas sp. FW306-02-H06C]PMZ15230.1 flagellar basal body-associated protein FliL [Pseudomonas sp. FW306-02-F02-AA]PMZ22533.1 flagellar basal body-associated protein FliL [Pseudomonas sp. FW306-02-F08-AA]
MPAFGLMPVSYRMIGVAVLLAIVAGGAAAASWHLQDWRYGRQLAEQARLHGEALNQLTLAAANQQRTEQDKRLALEQRLQASDQTYSKALSDAQRDQGRLRDRLATADLRLSVLVDPREADTGCAVSAASGTGGVVHGTLRARLEPAHAQRIIGITDTGDRGLIALQACQAYVRALAR